MPAAQGGWLPIAASVAEAFQEDRAAAEGVVSQQSALPSSSSAS